MKMMRILLMAAALIISGTIALAQHSPARGPSGDEMGLDSQTGQWSPASKEKREEVRKRVEAIRIYRLTEALKLDEKTSAKLAALLGSLDQQRQELMNQNIEAMRVLRSSLMETRPDEGKLKPILDKLEKNHREMVELKEKELRGLKDILTVEQRARYVVFQRDFMREIRGMIAGNRGSGQGIHGGPGSGKTGTGPGMGAGRPPENR